MLKLLTKRQINIAFILIILALIPLQIVSSLHQVDLSIWEKSAPFSHFLYEFIGIDLLQNPLFDFFAATLLITIQLLLLYNFLSRIKKLEEYSIFICWIYCWLIHFYPGWSKFTPILIALTLLMFILQQCYRNMESLKDNFLFNSSLVLGISFLIWYPSILLVAFLYVLFFQYNALTVKRFFIVIASFIIPTIHLIAYYFLVNNSLQIIYQFSNFHLSSLQVSQLSYWNISPIIFILISSIIGAINTLSLSAKTAKITRLFLTSLFTLLPFLILGVFLSNNLISYSLLLSIFPLSIFLVLFINKIKRPILAELVHFTLILCVLFNFIYILEFQ